MDQETVERENERLMGSLRAIQAELERDEEHNTYDSFSAMLYADSAFGFEECYELDEDPKTGLKILEYLDFSRWDHLKKLPQGMFQLTTMQSLHLASCTSLQQIPPDIRRLDQISDLDLTRCSSLKRIPKEITSSLLNLKRLTLSYCDSLEELPRVWPGTSNLESLSLEGCRKLKDLPEGMWVGCQNLIYLGLRRLPCLDPCLPPGIANLSRLKTLNVRDSPNLRYLFKTPEETLPALVDLHSVFANQTPLQAIPINELAGLRNLHRVTFEGCPHLPEAFTNSQNQLVHLLRILVHTRSRASLLELALWKTWGWSDNLEERAGKRQACGGINTVIQGVLPFLCGETAATMFPFYCHSDSYAEVAQRN